jgi:hypothetical protein|tara:strand:- start:19390 stop:19854 length:465 start_codon:yes stop_codon:yes gene_type:complete
MIGRTILSLTAFIVLLGASPTFSQDRIFTAEAGMVFHPIQPDKTEDFEMVLRRVRDALHESESALRRNQAENWKVYQAVEPGPQDSVLYIFVIDPALEEADYTIGNILREELPLEAQTLYETFASCYAYSPSMINMRLASDFNESATSDDNSHE